jgi:DeoR/GlpR family transcriptional regulator of sugar metabolism
MRTWVKQAGRSPSEFFLQGTAPIQMGKQFCSAVSSRLSKTAEDGSPAKDPLHFLIVHAIFLVMHGSSGAVRKSEIQSRLERGLPVNATALAKEFMVSEDAIRRDLRALAAEGKCKRVYGGGLPIAPDGISLQHRLLNDSKEKRALALAALSLVSEASTIFLDSGTTNLALAREMPANRPLTIATNSISIASALLDRKNLKVIVLGGEIDRETGAAIGLSAVREAERLSFDVCFLGACAISVSLGLGAFHMADAEFKRTLVTRSDRIAALVTADKVETRAPFQVAALGVLDHLVLEFGTPEETVSALASAGPKVILGQP